MNGANESIAVDVVDDTVNTLYWSQSGFGGGTGGYPNGDQGRWYYPADGGTGGGAYQNQGGQQQRITLLIFPFLNKIY